MPRAKPVAQSAPSGGDTTTIGRLDIGLRLGCSHVVGMSGRGDLGYCRGLRGRWGHLGFEGPIGRAPKFRYGVLDRGVCHEDFLVEPRRVHMRLLPTITELSQDSYSVIDEYKRDEDDAEIVALLKDDPRFLFRDETWSHRHFTYDPPPVQFQGFRRTSTIYDELPTLLQLWKFFWPSTCMRTIVWETNSYAETIVDAFSHTMGGLYWVPLIVAGLRAFIALHIYMGLKKQPNVKTY